MTRITFVHTGAVVIATFAELAATLLDGVSVHHLLDDRIVADLGQDPEQYRVKDRLEHLALAAADAGSAAVVLTCSSISGYAPSMAQAAGIPVLRIDEAMADEAVTTAQSIAVLATLPTTLRPTMALLHERAEHRGLTPTFAATVIDGAFAAVSSGDRATHDRLVADAVLANAEHDVIVLAQASMASAVSAVDVATPVLTSPELGVRRVADFVRALAD